MASYLGGWMLVRGRIDWLLWKKRVRPRPAKLFIMVWNALCQKFEKWVTQIDTLYHFAYHILPRKRLAVALQSWKKIRGFFEFSSSPPPTMLIIRLYVFEIYFTWTNIDLECGGGGGGGGGGLRVNSWFDFKNTHIFITSLQSWMYFSKSPRIFFPRLFEIIDCLIILWS
jgi:hypothetical protein